MLLAYHRLRQRLEGGLLLSSKRSKRRRKQRPWAQVAAAAVVAEVVVVAELMMTYKPALMLSGRLDIHQNSSTLTHTVHLWPGILL